jgi:hypothetical protein
MRRLIVVLAATAAASAMPAAAGAAPVDLDSGLGCSANCIRSALVTTSANAAKIEVKADTPARFEVVIRKRSAMGAGTGGFTTGAIVATRTSSPTPTKGYTTVVTGLQPDMLYAISVTATDAKGGRNTRLGTFRTKKAQTVDAEADTDALASEAGCNAQCIRTAEATAGMSTAQLRVRTSTPAMLEVIPGQGAPTVATSAYSTDATVTLRGLRAGRTYNVTVRATDANGGVSFREGTFETLERNVVVQFLEIRVSENGEKRSSNKGELTFWGSVNNGWQIKRSEGKVKDGARVHFKNQGTIRIDNVGKDIAFNVQGVERDTKGSCVDSLRDGPFSSPLTGSAKKKCIVGSHKRTWNTAGGWLDLEGTFGDDGGSYDTVIYATDGRVRFYVDVRIYVWDE